MKKFITIIATLMLLIPCFQAYSAPKKSNLTPMGKFINANSEVEGVSAMTVKGLMLGIAKQSLKDTPADVLMKEINSISMFMIEDCPKAEVDRLTKEMEAILKNYMFLGETTDDGDTLIMYIDGITDGGFRELVMIIKGSEEVVMTINGNFTKELLDAVMESDDEE